MENQSGHWALKSFEAKSTPVGVLDHHVKIVLSTNFLVWNVLAHIYMFLRYSIE
jgi:hypothetical protein